MAKQEQAGQPAQVPGDAESPVNSEADDTAKNGIRHIDETEPVQRDTDKRSE